MLVYYRRSGANATLALLLNAVLVLAALSYCDAVLTLPGIAGVALTIGMAVDSNVLIFERIREELRDGKPAGLAVAGGFRKALGTIVDTHVTTVVSCCFLYLFGTAPVKGFAITLLIGLITNVFTAVFVSKVAFDWELRAAGPAARLSI
jgi:preprotein translocase subunit SecD